MNLISAQKRPAIVQKHGQDLFVNSNIIAELFDRPHKNVMRDIVGLAEKRTISRLNLEPRTYIDSRGKTQPAYRLTERDALVLMPFIGGQKAEEGQARLVDEFLRLRTELRLIASRQHDPILQLALKSKCLIATLMTDCLVEARSTLGKDTKPHHFANEHSLCNWVLSGCYGQVDDAYLNEKDSNRLTRIRRRNAVLIVQGMSYPKRKEALRASFPLMDVASHD